jgi:hypothetical protein
MGNDVKEKLND